MMEEIYDTKLKTQGRAEITKYHKHLASADYTNILQILSLCNIPFYAQDRDNRYPLIIGGGPCVLNPEPLADFFDLFIIGEAEEALFELVRNYNDYQDAYKAGKLAKHELLLRLSKIEGVYVPSLSNTLLTV